MERYFQDVSKLNIDKAQELYEKVCIEIIENNPILKEKALGMTIKVCDMHIEENTKKDQDRDPLCKITPIWIGIKNSVLAMVKKYKNETT